jgi:hypothetical protein
MALILFLTLIHLPDPNSEGIGTTQVSRHPCAPTKCKLLHMRAGQSYVGQIKARAGVSTKSFLLLLDRIERSRLLVPGKVTKD